MAPRTQLAGWIALGGSRYSIDTKIIDGHVIAYGAEPEPALGVGFRILDIKYKLAIDQVFEFTLGRDDLDASLPVRKMASLQIVFRQKWAFAIARVTAKPSCLVLVGPVANVIESQRVTKYLRMATNHLIADESSLGKNEARGITVEPNFRPYGKVRRIHGLASSVAVHHVSLLPGD